jgi:hypothetical protein
MKRLPICTTIAALCLFVSANAIAASPTGTGHLNRASVTQTLPSHTSQPTTLGPSRTGQPNQSCGSATAPNTPGNAAQAPGSAFNPDGRAGTVYAGEQPQNSRNTASVSQYDVACFHQR